jgi:hypothetical protein
MTPTGPQINAVMSSGTFVPGFVARVLCTLYGESPMTAEEVALAMGFPARSAFSGGALGWLRSAGLVIRDQDQRWSLTQAGTDRATLAGL